MTTTHAHIATQWQLQAAAEGKLEAIALPLLPEPRKTNNTWFWDGFKPEDLGIFWYEHEKVGNRLLNKDRDAFPHLGTGGGQGTQINLGSLGHRYNSSVSLD